MGIPDAIVLFGHWSASIVLAMISGVAAVELTCVECARLSDAEARGWQGHLVAFDDDTEEGVVFFCPVCAAREFGEPRPRRRQSPET